MAEIVHSAYTDEERKEIKLWKDDAVGAYNWNPYIKQVVSEIEGLEGDLVVQERAELLRSKIKIASCNINDDPQSKKQIECSLLYAPATHLK